MPPKKRTIKSPLTLAPAPAPAPKKSGSGSGLVWLSVVGVLGLGAWYFFTNYSVRRVSPHERETAQKVAPAPAPAKVQDAAEVVVDVVAQKRSEALAELVTFRYVKDAESLNALDKDFYTPLMRAAFHNDFHVAQLLVDAGAEVDFINPRGFTALLLAIPHVDMDGNPIKPDVQGGLKMMRFLIASGADVNFHRFNIRTPLAWAAAIGAPEAVQLLLDAGADPAFVDEQGRDALSIAKENKNAGAVRILERATRKK